MKNETDFTEKRNLFIAALLTILILFSMETLFPSAKKETPILPQNAVLSAQSATNTDPIVASTPETNTSVNALPQPTVTQTLKIKNAALEGKFNVQQGRLFEAELLKYKETTEKDSSFVKLLYANALDKPKHTFADTLSASGQSDINARSPGCFNGRKRIC